MIDKEQKNVPPVRLRLRREQRLRKSSEFQQVYDGKCSTADGVLIVYARPNDLGYSRLGVSVGRRLGGAVRRNRFKRVLREAYRLEQHVLPQGYDFVLIPRAVPEAQKNKINTQRYRQSLVGLCQRLQKRIERERET